MEYKRDETDDENIKKHKEKNVRLCKNYTKATRGDAVDAVDTVGAVGTLPLVQKGQPMQ